MGMDYSYSGSSSYPRFDREIKSLVELFGGRETKELEKRKETENERPCGYWFGYMSSAEPNMQKYVFPKETNEILVKWFNNIYNTFTEEETVIVFTEIKKHKAKVLEISSQIYNELETLCECNEGWYIY